MVGSPGSPNGRGEERAWRGRRPCGRGPGGGWLPWARWRECSSCLPPPWQRPAQAAPGDLDLTFSGDGKQTTNLGFGASRAAAIVRQPDGKIVAVGSDRQHGDDDFALARYNTDGSLDTSFSGDGKKTTDFGGDDDQATGVALQGDGKIVVVGSAGGCCFTPINFALARYNPNGSLDTSFSGDGKQTTDFGGDGGANGVALQADGKIVAVGTRAADAPTSRSPATTPNGSLDTSFSGDGKQTTDFGGSDVARGVAIQGDGKIVAVGNAGRATSRSPATTRTARSTRASPATASRRPTSGAPTGRAGWRSRGRQDRRGRASDGADFALARYNPNGSLDTSFSGDGKQTTDFGGSDGANGVALQGDGKIVAVGNGAAARLRARPLQPRRLARHELLRRRQADDRLRGRRRGERGGAPGRRQDRRGRLHRRRTPQRRLRARPLQRRRLARHELLRRRQADDRLRGHRRGDRGGAPGRRQDRRGRVRRRRSQRLDDDFALARYNAERLARHELLRRRQAEDRLRGLSMWRAGWRSRATARSSWSARAGAAPTSRSPATTPTARSTRASPATASRRPTSGAPTRATGVALQGDGKIVAVGRHAPATSRSPATTPTARSTRASPATASRRPTSGASARKRPGWRSRATARSWLSATAGAAALRSTSRSPATTPTARSTRASLATASRRPTSGTSTGRPGWRSRATARSSRSAAPGRRRRLRARPLQPERLARHELLRRRQADDRLRGLRRGERGGAPGRRQDRRGRR